MSILDENAHPLPGAVFYVEAADESGPFAYLWAIAGQAGEVPNTAREPLKIPWRRGARLAMAAFSPGRRPCVLAEKQGRILSDGAVLQLGPGEAWAPELQQLGLPFAPNTPLAEQFERDSEAPLREVVRAAWSARPGSAGGENSTN